MKHFNLLIQTAGFLAAVCTASLAQAGGGSEGGWPTLDHVSSEGRVLSIESCAWYHPIAISEHDPLWQCAAVEVASGYGAGTTIEVVFSGSDDVAWFHSPKLHESDAGTFQMDTRTLAGHLQLTQFSPSNTPGHCTEATKPTCGAIPADAECCSISGAFLNLQWVCVPEGRGCPQVP